MVKDDDGPLDLDVAGASRWGDGLWLAHTLKSTHQERWVRFHSLPESRRYPDSEFDYATLLSRQHTLLADLGAPSELVVLTCEWSDSPSPRGRSADLERVAPGRYWHTSLTNPEEPDPQFRVYTHLYAATLSNRPHHLDPLLRMIADDRTAGVILTPADFGWLVHPYDGGTDVIAATPADRDALRAEHPDWL